MSDPRRLRKLATVLKREMFPSSNPKQDAYLRFGEWPEDERSQNFIGGGREAGVSVYPLAHERGVPHPAVPEGEWTLDDYRDRLRDTKTPRWLVEGDQVGLGGDGEPLLRDVRRLGDYGQPYNPLTPTPTERFTDNFAHGGPVNTPTEGEGGLYGAPDSMFNTPESLAAALYPQHDTAYGDGGPVHMALGGTPPNTAPAVPDMPQLPESEGAGFFRNNDNENYAGQLDWLRKAGAPTILRPGKVQDVHNWASKVGGAEQGRRVEQAADLTNLGHFSSNALHETFAPGNSSLLMALPPGRFEDFSARLPAEYMARTPYGRYRTEWLRQNSVPGHGRIPDSEKTMDAYLSQLFHHMATKGADEVPTMWLAPPRPLYGEVAQHQGRHRARAMAQAGEENMLLHIKPANEGDMRGSLAERLERLTDKYFPSGAATRFEPEMDWKRRIPLSFPFAPFAEGGEVEMAGGGADKIKEAAGWLRRLSNYSDPASKHINDYQWKPMPEVGARLGQIDAIPPHVEDFGAFMQEQAQRAANEGLTPRDLLKAYGITRSSIQRKAQLADLVRATGLNIPGSDPTIRPEGAFATWMGTPHGQSWLDKGERGIVDFDAINDAKQKLANFGKNERDLPQFLQWGPENLPGREGRLSELVDRARKTGNSAPEEWKDAVGDLFGIGLAKRGFFSAMLGRGDQPVLDARQIDLHVPKGYYAEKYGRRGNTEGGDEIMARLAARQEALGIGVPKDLMPFQQYLTHHTTWDKLGNEATTHQDLIDSLRGHAEGGPIEMQVGGAEKIKDAVGFLRRTIMPHAREQSVVPPNRDIESRYWNHKKPPNLDTITADYSDHPPVDVPTMKIEDIKGGRLFAIPHDRSATDITLGGYNGNTFADPVTSPGGPLYAFGRNPEAVTASGESVTKKLHESAVRSADEGRTPYLAPWLMGPHGVDFSTHMNEAVVQSLPFLKVPSAKKDEVNAMLSTVFKDFPGIDHNDLAQYLHSMVGTTRRDLPKLLDKGEMVNAGLDVGGLRAALTEPSLLHAPYGSSGAAISRIDPSKSPTMFGYPNHPSYPWQLQGTPVGGLDPLVPSQILYPDFYRGLPPETQLGPKGKPVNNRRAFEMSSMKGGVYQDVNDEVVNKVNEFQEYMRNIRGRKEGGTVEDQYHPIWQQSFQAGGQPESESRGYYTKKEQAAIARQRNAERIGKMNEEINADPGAHWRDLLTQIPRGAASIAELPGLAGDLLNYRADYLDSVAPGSGSMRVPHWGTSEGISQGLDSVFPTPTSPHGGQTGRELGEMGLNMFGLGAAQKMGRLAHMGNAANLGFILGGGSGNDTEPAEWQAPPEPSYAYERFMRDHAPKHQAYNPSFHGYAHGGSVEDQYHPIWSQNFAQGGPSHAPDFGDNFKSLPGIGSLMDIAGGIFGGEDVDLHSILGEGGRALGTLVGAYFGMPGVGGSLGEFGGDAASDLIEPGSGDVGNDAMRVGAGFAKNQGMSMFMAGGGAVDDFTEPGMPSFGPGIPGFDVDMLPTNPQVARDRADRQRLMQMTEQASQKGLAQQMKPKDSGGGGGGGMGDIMGMVKMAAQFAPMFLADGGRIPAPNGEQPWMYGGGALMARGGYLRSRGGMNG